MLKLFISQVFHNRSEDEIFKERREIIDKLVGDDLSYYYGCTFYVIDNYHIKVNKKSKKDRMDQMYHMMREADLIVFGPGWESVEGCKMEMDIACLHGMNRMIIE